MLWGVIAILTGVIIYMTTVLEDHRKAVLRLSSEVRLIKNSMYGRVRD